MIPAATDGWLAAAHATDRAVAAEDAVSTLEAALDEAERHSALLERELCEVRAERDRLLALFEAAGEGTYNVLALVEHYQARLSEAEGRAAELGRMLEAECDAARAEREYLAWLFEAAGSGESLTPRQHATARAPDARRDRTSSGAGEQACSAEQAEGEDDEAPATERRPSRTLDRRTAGTEVQGSARAVRASRFRRPVWGAVAKGESSMFQQVREARAIDVARAGPSRHDDTEAKKEAAPTRLETAACIARALTRGPERVWGAYEPGWLAAVELADRLGLVAGAEVAMIELGDWWLAYVGWGSSSIRVGWPWGDPAAPMGAGGTGDRSWELPLGGPAVVVLAPFGGRACPVAAWGAWSSWRAPGVPSAVEADAIGEIEAQLRDLSEMGVVP